MTNAELFKKIFGVYAEEFWAYSEGKMLDWLNSDAPAQSEQEWTPVSEGLPKDEVDVLVTDDSGGYATTGIDCMFTRLSGKREWLASQRVTAWMPAPAPYKEKSNA